MLSKELIKRMEAYNEAEEQAFEFIAESAKNGEPEGVGFRRYGAIEKVWKYLTAEEIKEILGIGIINTMFVLRKMEDEENKEGE